MNPKVDARVAPVALQKKYSAPDSYLINSKKKVYAI